jgi:uncharacterized cofD-like protein
LHDPRQATLSLVPFASANPMAIAAIEQADMVVIAPGDLYSSLGPLFVIDGIKDALIRTKAMKVYVSNLVTKHKQTTGFSVADYAGEIERFVGAPFLDFVLYNKQKPNRNVAKRYKQQKAYLVNARKSDFKNSRYRAINGNFLGGMAKYDRKSNILPVTRSLIRHDAEAVASALINLYKDEINTIVR